MARSIEVEWQLVPRSGDALYRYLRQARVDGWTLTPSASRRLRDAYYDTADWRVARAGFALRVRRSGARLEATLKALRRARGGVARRREITAGIPTARIATVETSRGAVGRRLRRIRRTTPLRRLFGLRTWRRVFVLDDGRGTIAEVAVDRTDVVGGRGRRRRIERLEVEVKAGSPARVAAFVATLRRRRHLTVARRSKFEEGLRAAALAVPRR